MSDPRIENLAKLLVEYCVEVEPGHNVLLGGSSLALPLLEEVYRYVLRAGGHPLVVIQDDVFQEILFKEGNDEQLKKAVDELLKEL